MAVYVDNALVPWRGQHWCHLVADSFDELHEFAEKLSLPRSWFHRRATLPHYDITVDVRLRAIDAGAIPSTSRQIVSYARKLKAERVLALTSRPGQAQLFDEAITL